MNKQKFSIAVLLAALVWPAGCSKEKLRRAEASPVDENTVNVVFEDGTTAQTIEDYEAALATQGIDVIEGSPFALTVSVTGDDPLLSVGKFQLRLMATNEYIGGCISQKLPHLVVAISKEGLDFVFVEVHLAGWFSGKDPCLGVYNNSAIAHGLCYKGCFKDLKSGIKTSLKNEFIGVGVGGTVAAVSAALLAPVAARALAPLLAAAAL